MLKALYDFEATLAKTLSFTEGEFFFLQQSNAKQRNWWHVVNKKGQVGFVPSNYVAAVKVTGLTNYHNILTTYFSYTQYSFVPILNRLSQNSIWLF